MDFFAVIFLVIVVGIIAILYFFWQRKQIVGKRAQLQSQFGHQYVFAEFFFLFSLIYYFYAFLLVRRDFFPGLEWTWVLLYATATGFILAYRFRLRFSLIAAIGGLVVWWISQASIWLVYIPQKIAERDYTNILLEKTDIKYIVVISGFLLISLLLYVAGQIHQRVAKYKHFADIYTILGLILVMIVLFVFAQRDGLTMFARALEGVAVHRSWQLVVVLGIFVGAFAAAMHYLWKKKIVIAQEILALLVLGGVFISFIFLPYMGEVNTGMSYMSSSSKLTSIGWAYALFFNILLFIFLLGVIFSGYVRRQVWRINLGAVLLFIYIFMKYFDWFFTFLDKSIFFISAGVLLFVVGFFMERGRRLMVSSVTREENKSKK